MHRDGVQFGGLAEEGRRRFCDVFMGGAVEAIAADAQLFIQRVGRGYRYASGPGSCRIRYRKRPRWERRGRAFRNVDAHQVGRVVQRARGSSRDDFSALVVDKHGIGDRLRHAARGARLPRFRLVLDNALSSPEARK